MASRISPTRLPAIDSLRGVAILLVIVTHFGFVALESYTLTGVPALLRRAASYGWVGVDLFFVLSGFLITSLLLERRARRDYYRDFYVRRVLRILPAYAAVLVILIATGLMPVAFVWTSVLFVANFAGPGPTGNAFGVLWSLSVEEQFYLVWPTVIRKIVDRSVWVVGMIVLLASPIARGIAFQAGLSDHDLYYWTFFHLDALGMGILLAAWFRSDRASSLGKRLPLMLGVAALLGGVIGVPYGLLSRSSLVGASFQFTFIAVVFGAIVGAALSLQGTKWERVVDVPILRFYGDISYGLYLSHVLVLALVLGGIAWLAPAFIAAPTQPGLAFGEVLIAFAAATAIAYVSRWHFEARFLALKEKFSPSPRKAHAVSLDAPSADRRPTDEGVAR